LIGFDGKLVINPKYQNSLHYSFYDDELLLVFYDALSINMEPDEWIFEIPGITTDKIEIGDVLYPELYTAEEIRSIALSQRKEINTDPGNGYQVTCFDSTIKIRWNHIGDDAKVHRVNVFDMSGRRVQEFVFTGNEVQRNVVFPTGMYVVHIESDEITESHKVLVLR
jgi:hypothetical protein